MDAKFNAFNTVNQWWPIFGLSVIFSALHMLTRWGSCGFYDSEVFNWTFMVITKGRSHYWCIHYEDCVKTINPSIDCHGNELWLFSIFLDYFDQQWFHVKFVAADITYTYISISQMLSTQFFCRPKIQRSRIEKNQTT